MNPRRRTLVGAAAASAALACARGALSQERARRLGCLVVGRRENDYTLPVFLEQLGALGHVVGRNLHVEVRYGEGDLARLPALARELVDLRPDVIMTANPAGVGAALAVTKSIPIVMGTMSDPVVEGFVASLSRPGGNVTGVVNQGEDLIPKQFELARELLPRAARIAFVVSQDPALRKRSASFVAVAEESARRLGLQLLVLHASSRADLEAIGEPLARARPDVLVAGLDPVYHAFRRLLIDATAKLRLPAVYPLPVFSDDGGLLSYGFNLLDSFRRAAAYVDRILKGAKPSELPVERPLKFEMIVNLRTARSLRLAMPQPLLLRADRVIE